MSNQIEIRKFQDIPLDDPFFDSLKEDYNEFEAWFKGKSNETAYVQSADNKIIGFLYVKTENGEIADVAPPLPSAKRVKIGTFKVDAHGTRLGERLLKKAFDKAIVEQVNEIYVTVFPKHKALITLLKEFGFTCTGTKTTHNGVEQVLLKIVDNKGFIGDLRKDYPLVNTQNVKSYILSIYPEWHTKLFPDSILNTEHYDLLADISHTNSISKTYICSMSGVADLKAGDLLAIYRTSDHIGPAEYRSVITSVCAVEEVKRKSSFSNVDEFIAYNEPYSVFNASELRKRWSSRGDIFVIKMLYNAALTKRVIRKTLIENIGIQRDIYWGFLPLTKDQLLAILSIGGVDGRIIVH